VSRTDEAGGEADPAASPSRARVVRHGWVPWAAGVIVAVAQLLVLVLARGQWRTEGAVGLVVVTLGGVGFAVFGGDDRSGQ
jgi:hypothetical protein